MRACNNPLLLQPSQRLEGYCHILHTCRAGRRYHTTKTLNNLADGRDLRLGIAVRVYLPTKLYECESNKYAYPSKRLGVHRSVQRRSSLRGSPRISACSGATWYTALCLRNSIIKVKNLTTGRGLKNIIIIFLIAIIHRSEKPLAYSATGYLFKAVSSSSSGAHGFQSFTPW